MASSAVASPTSKMPWRRWWVLPTHPGATGEVFNVGSAQEITIADLATRIKEMTHSDSRIVFVPYDEAYEEGFEDMLRRVPDISKVSNLLGWEPRISMDETLHNIIDEQRQLLSQEPVQK